MNDKLTVYIEPVLLRAFKRAAFNAERTLSGLVTDAMREYLRRHCPPGTATGQSPEKGAAAEPHETTGLSAVNAAIIEQAKILRDIQHQLASLKTADQPIALPMPKGAFTDVERVILELVCGAGAKGILASEFQDHMSARSIPTGKSRSATATLQKRGFLKRTRYHWQLKVPASEGVD